MDRARGSFRLTVEQRIDAIKFIYQCNNNISAARRKFEERWNISAPRHETFKSLLDKFEQTGSVHHQAGGGRPPSVNTEENRDTVATMLTQSPRKSLRRLSSETGISKSHLGRMLKEMDYKPYRPRLVHHLNDDDPDRRREFCELLFGQCHANSDFLDSIVWSDEAKFMLNGRVNRHNCYYWDTKNPHKIISSEMHAPGVMTWAGITSTGMVGPFFFPEGAVTGKSYLEFLRNQVFPVLRNHANINTLYFQQDGAPPHYHVEVRAWLDEHFPQRWIGRRGPIEWPARSPDLSPMDFFVWGYVRDKVYACNPRSLDELRNLIDFHVRDIPVDLTRKVCQSVYERCEQCVDADGYQFEHLR